MSPTIFRHGDFRFYFFSREEPRMHVHVHRSGGEAKFWIEPKIKLAQNYGLTARQLNTARRLIEEHENEIRGAWKEHFRG
jgi:ribosomal protein L16/L10AE